MGWVGWMGWMGWVGWVGCLLACLLAWSVGRLVDWLSSWFIGWLWLVGPKTPRQVLETPRFWERWRLASTTVLAAGAADLRD